MLFTNGLYPFPECFRRNECRALRCGTFISFLTIDRTMLSALVDEKFELERKFVQRSYTVRNEFEWKIVKAPSPSTILNRVQARAARRRLLRDYKEVLSCPIPGVSAAPVDDNIFQWHVNLCPTSGPYAGITLHCGMLFDVSYPKKPPELRLATPLSHP